ncbi:hypothetical protein AVEN_69363-1 [Araneus ventricosus]|uniref:DDE-1 domain-containing protein n=1 Tax=Araneus ventricosus TaxID=182803 RepID=A0A4Y2JWY6_ARAVE|nr:hypothetical protein AVEN_69363-1 [Araneus ventricosus]
MPPNTTSKLQHLNQGIIHNFKIKYRHEVVKKCIAEIYEGTKPVVYVLQAMRMADKAWNCVEAKTVANCFKKAGFLKKVEVSNSNDSVEILNDIHAVESINEEWYLISNALQVDPLTTFQDFVEICGDLTDADIVGEVRSLSKEEDDDEMFEPPPKMTLKEAFIFHKNNACIY